MKKILLPFVAIVLLTSTCARKPEVISVKSGPSWYKSPMLAVMTGFIYYPKSDYSIWEWEKDLGRDFNARDFVQTLKDANIDYLIFYDKWIDGLVFHDTRTTGFKTIRDFFKEVSEACNAHDVKLVVYYNAVSDGNPEFERGFARDYFGNYFPFSSFWPTHRSTLHDPVFRENSLAQLNEIVSNYGITDGIWFDIFSEVGDARNACIIRAAENRFQKAFDDISRDEFYLFQQETMGDYIRDAREIATQNQEDIVFTVNGSVRSMDGNHVRLNNVDYLLDYWMTETNTFASTDFHSWRAHFSPKPVEMGSLISADWFTVKDGKAPGLRSASRSEVISETALAVCRGSSIYLAITPGYDGSMGEGIGAVAAAGNWYGKVKPYLNNAEMYGDIGVVLGTPSVDGRGFPSRNEFWRQFEKDQIGALNEAISLCEDISGAGFFPKVLYAYADYSSWPASLRGFKAIVIPELAVLDKNHVQRLRDYVRDGGTMISFAHATVLNEKGEQLADPALRDLFGVQNKAGSEQDGGVIVLSDSALYGFFDGKLPELRRTLKPVFDPAVHIIASLNGEAERPLIIQKDHGTGRSVYVAASEAEFRGMSSFWTGILGSYGIGQSFTLVDPSITDSINRKPPWNAIGMWQKRLDRYYVVLKETTMGKVIHIIDRKGDISEVTLSLDAALIGNVAAARKLESDTAVHLDYGNNRISFSVSCDPVASILFEVK